MKIYYNPLMFPDAPEECVIDDVVFIKSDSNEIVIESELDEENWQEIMDNADGFLEYVEDIIYESLDEELKSNYANYSVGTSDILEFEFVITRTYLHTKLADSDCFMENQYKVFRKPYISTIIVHQRITDIFPHYPFNPIFRSDEHKYKSNNWLKLHGKSMRRKPFKKEQPFILLDEFYTV